MHSSKRMPCRRLNTRARLLTAAILGCYATAPAWAQLPTNPVIQSGTAGFSQSGNVLTVTNSNGAIIRWDTFNIGKGYTTHFQQDSAASSVLNRVVGGNPANFSQIYGTLSSNGKVWLINPNGITIGPGGLVNTAGFVASTLDVTNANFLAGKLTFEKTPGAGNVVNQGTIRTPSGGSVYLIGANVKNETVAGHTNEQGVNDSGLIETPQGETILAAGETVEIVDTGTPGVKVKITGAAGNTTNLGTVLAEAGRIGMAGVIVRNSGLLNASSVVSEGGRVFLKASQDTYVDGNGRIVATGTKGGKVEVLGNRVAVMDEAEIDVSGTNGGGTILVGGDYQGKNADVQNAQITYFGRNAKLKADATNNGNGGKVIVWANDATRAFGTISARGGANGGNGGFVEVSGKGLLQFRAKVDTRAPKGLVGTLLLDPTSITIYEIDDGAYDGAFDDGNPNVFSPNFSPDSVLGWDTIYSLLGTSDLIVQTGDGDISIAQGSGSSYLGDNSLSLLAGRNIVIRSGGYIDNSEGLGNIKLVAGWTGASTTAPSVTAGSGDITLEAGTYVKTSGGIDILAGKDLSLGGEARIESGGSMTVSTGGAITVGPGSTIVAGTNDSTATQAITARGNITINGGIAADDTQSSITNSGGGLQTVTSTGGGIAVKGGLGAGGSEAAEIYATGNQVVTAASDIELRGGSGSYSSARIYAEGSQTVSTSGNLTLTGGTGGTLASANVEASGNQFIRANAIKLQAGSGGEGTDAKVTAGGTQAIQAASLTLLGSASGIAEVSSNGAMNIIAGSITASLGSIRSWNGAVSATVSGDIRLTNDSLIASGPLEDVNLTLDGANSKLYLNDSAAMPPSTIQPGNGIEIVRPGTTRVVFNNRVSGGVVIDGVETTTTVDGGSGFFIPLTYSRYLSKRPATEGAGLDIAYRGTTPSPGTSGTTPDLGTSDATKATITAIINATNRPPTTTPNTPLLPPPPTGSGAASLGNQSVGGGDNEFGGSGDGSGKDKDKQANDKSGNGKDDNKPSGKKTVGKCNA